MFSELSQWFPPPASHLLPSLQARRVRKRRLRSYTQLMPELVLLTAGLQSTLLLLKKTHCFLRLSASASLGSREQAEVFQGALCYSQSTKLAEANLINQHSQKCMCYRALFSGQQTSSQVYKNRQYVCVVTVNSYQLLPEKKKSKLHSDITKWALFMFTVTNLKEKPCKILSK